MKRILTIVLCMMLLCGTAAAVSAGTPGAQLRYDGVYYFGYMDDMLGIRYCVLRFYEDGRVLSGWTTGKLENEQVFSIDSWQGTITDYTVEGDHLACEFHIDSNIATYEGTIEEDRLVLDIFYSFSKATYIARGMLFASFDDIAAGDYPQNLYSLESDVPKEETGKTELTGPQLRYDGVYYFAYMDDMLGIRYCVLRFYKDGRVLSGWTTGKLESEEVFSIDSWQGSITGFTEDEDRIACVFQIGDNVATYEGTIGENKLILDIYYSFSKANYKDREMLFASFDDIAGGEYPQNIQEL